MKKTSNKRVNRRVETPSANDALFERGIKIAMKRLPAVVKEKAFRNNASITIVRDSKMIRINPDNTIKVVGKIKKIDAKVKIQKVMSLS